MKMKNTIIACLAVCLCMSLYFNARLDVYNSRKKEPATLVKEEPKNKISAADEYDNGCGMAINFAKYIAAVENPEQYPDEIAKLEAIGVPLNIDTKME